MDAVSPKLPEVPKMSPERRRAMIRNYLSRYWTLYVLLILPISFFIIFRYIPMSYIQIGWKQFMMDGRSVWEMEWVGWKYFQDAFNNRDFFRAIRNTLTLNMLDLVLGFPMPILMAILLNELAFKRYKRVTQTITYMPHFLSWVIIAELANQLFAPSSGLVNILLTNMGIDSVAFMTKPWNWMWTYGWIGVWQNLGWGSILYLSAMTSINPELYEAAVVDGASRMRRIWHITLPGIRPTMVVLLIMNLGNIVRDNFERPFALRNKLVYEASDVLAIFVYNYGLKAMKFSLASAVGIFQSVVCLVFLIASNQIAKRLGERGIM